jgi:hypothetical protein
MHCSSVLFVAKYFSQKKVREILSSLSSSSIVNLEKRGVDPENWAAGYFIAFSQEEKSN